MTTTRYCQNPHCDRSLNNRQKRFCSRECVSKKPRHDVSRYNQVVSPNLELLKTGCWMLFPRDADEQECVGEFMRVFERAPEHCIEENWWKFIGPVFDEEEMAFRYQGRDRERKRLQEKRK